MLKGEPFGASMGIYMRAAWPGRFFRTHVRKTAGLRALEQPRGFS